MTLLLSPVNTTLSPFITLYLDPAGIILSIIHKELIKIGDKLL